MAWTTNPYCALADVHNVLNLKSTQDDSWITTLISEAQAAVDEYIGRTFQTNTTTQVYDGTDMVSMIIGDCVSGSITQVLEVNYGVYFTGGGMGLAPTSTPVDITSDCVLGPNNWPIGYKLVRISGAPFVRGVQSYKVTATFGNPTIPAPIARATARIASHWYKMRDTAYADSIVDQANVRTKYLKPLPPDVVEVLEMYKRRSFVSR
jgi:hypothetical protein